MSLSRPYLRICPGIGIARHFGYQLGWAIPVDAVTVLVIGNIRPLIPLNTNIIKAFLLAGSKVQRLFNGFGTPGSRPIGFGAFTIFTGAENHSYFSPYPNFEVIGYILGRAGTKRQITAIATAQVVPAVANGIVAIIRPYAEQVLIITVTVAQIDNIGTKTIGKVHPIIASIGVGSERLGAGLRKRQHKERDNTAKGYSGR